MVSRVITTSFLRPPKPPGWLSFVQVSSKMVLGTVDDLSDAEGCGGECKSSSKRGPLKFPRKGFIRKNSFQKETVEPLKLRRLISSRCGCQCRCFQPFNGSISLFDTWVKLRKTMVDMKKLEKDQFVINLVSSPHVDTLAMLDSCPLGSTVSLSLQLRSSMR